MLLDGVILLEGSDVVNLTLPSGTSFPISPNVGEIFFNSTDNKVYVYYADVWSAIGGSTNNAVAVNSGTTLPDVNTVVEGELFILTTTNKIYSAIGGSWIQLSTPTPNIYDVGVSVPGTIIADSTIAFFITPRAFFLPSTLAGSIAAIGANNGAASFVVYRNSTLVATIEFAADSLTGTITPEVSETFTFNGGSTSYTGILFSVGDVFQIFAPSLNVPESFAVTFKTEIPL